MRRASVRIPALLGLDRNRVSGVDELAPDHLVNFMDARGGGYTPAGAWAGSPDVSWSGFPGFVGSDAMGLASLRSGAVSGEYRYGLYRGGGSFVSGSFAGGPGAGSHYGAHVPGVGAYASIDRFLVQDRDGNVVEPGDFGGGSGFVAPGVGDASGEPVYDSVGSFDVAAMDYDSVLDRWVAVGGSAGTFAWAYRDGDGEWTSGSVSVGSGRRVRALTRTSTTWVAVGANGLVMRSDDGVVWSDDSFGSHNFVDVTADPASGRVWAAPGVHAPGSSDRYIRASSDHGANWSTFDPDNYMSGSEMFPIALRFESLHNSLAIIYSNGLPSSTTPYLRSWDFSASGWRELTTSGSSVITLQLGVTTLNAGGDSTYKLRLGAGNRALILYGLTPDGNYGLSEVDLGGNLGRYIVPDLPLTDGVGFGDAVWVNGEWVVVGRGSRRFVGGAGAEWEELPFIQGDYTAAATDGAVVIAGGVGGMIAEFTPVGVMALGRYEVLFLVSLMTAAGKLVVYAGEDDFRVNVPAARSALAHSWSGADPDFAVNLTTDVYVRFTPRVFDEELGVWVINEPTGGYTHAASLAGGESWSVDAPGVGSQVLGISGGVAVAAFRNSDSANVVAEHNSRVWFQAGGSYAWRVLMGAFDFPTLEDERTVAFSVGGFVNLVELDGWLRLAATQSESLNGMLPSPQGLLILFDNEVFSLTGDVALNNLQALLFPDNVGLTAGCKAVLAGGVPISLWRGKLWALQSGVAQDVAAPVWRADDEFVDVVSDPLTRSAVALTVGGSLFALRTDTGFWFELPSVPAGGTERLLGSPSGFRAASEDGAFTRVREFVGGVLSPAVPEVAWLNLDAGDALRRDNWLNFRFSFEGAGAGAASPVAYYRPTDAGSSVPSVFSKDSGFRVVGVRRGDEWWFQFPVGLRSRRLDVLIEFPGVTRDFVVEPGVDFTILPGHLEGRRPQL